MRPKPKQIISASRRTDIPGCYPQWFMEGIQKGSFQVTNPFNQQTRTVDVSPELTHSIVFWSKNYGPFLDLNAHSILKEMGYHLFFNFTLNSPQPILEPRVPPLEERFAQARILCKDIGANALSWRFDPICFFQDAAGNQKNNLSAFKTIADTMGEMGVSSCVTSFYAPYKKVETRINKYPPDQKIRFTQLEIQERIDLIQGMAEYLKLRGIQLHLCTQGELEPHLEGIPANACVDGKKLKALYGGNPETRRDYGQRSKAGCRCTRSVDIGSYKEHPCAHNCLFCYARTQQDLTGQGKKI